MTLRSEVIICTRNRAKELGVALASCALQVPPPVVLVVDASDNVDSERVVGTYSSVAAAVPLDVRIVRSPPGLARQRMYGVASVRADTTIIHFIDDDVVLEDGYFSAIEAVFRDRADVAGVGGVITNLPPNVLRLHNRLFLLDSKSPGRVLSSGVNLLPVSPDRPIAVEWLSGCSMSYRRRVLEALSYDTRMEGYSLGEDVDFGYRVSRLGTLIVTPAARLEHVRSDSNRMAALDHLRRATAHRYRWVCEMRGNGMSLRAFFWSCCGLVAVGATKAVLGLRRSAARSVLAILKGIWDGVRSGVPPRNPRLRLVREVPGRFGCRTGRLVAVVIPTRNRPLELERCLSALVAEAGLLTEVVIADHSDDDASAQVCQRVATSFGTCRLHHLRTAGRGATRQRNEGLDALREPREFVLFLDDDAYVQPGYVGVLLARFVRGGDGCVAVSGVTVPRHEGSRGLLRAFKLAFLLEPMRWRGQVMLSGVVAALHGDDRAARAEWLNGCAMYRSEVIEVARFSEELKGYALYDDADLSVRASRAGFMLVEPCAKAVHVSASGGERLTRTALAEAAVVNRYWFLRRRAGSPLAVAAFWWSVAGLFILYGALSVRSPRYADLALGTRAGACAVLRGDVPGRVQAQCRE